MTFSIIACVLNFVTIFIIRISHVRFYSKCISKHFSSFGYLLPAWLFKPCTYPLFVILYLVVSRNAAFLIKFETSLGYFDLTSAGVKSTLPR